MIVSSYRQHVSCINSYEKYHNLYSKFKEKDCILVTIRTDKNLDLLIESSLTDSEKINIVNGNAYLLIDCSLEAILNFKSLRDNLPYPRENIKIISSSPDIGADELYQTFEKGSKILGKYTDKSPLELDTRKLYINFNRRHRSHRLALLMLLYKNDLLELGYNSFDHTLENYNNSYLKSVVDFKDIDFPDCEEMSKLFPLHIDTNNFKPNLAYTNPQSIKPYMLDSLISLVTETNYLKNEPRFLTEKCFKPIAYQQPFIMVSAPNTLTFLRELGYKTFDNVIDESYDTEINDSLRLIKIVNEIKRLSLLTNKELLSFKQEALGIVKYNYNLFINKKIYSI